MVEEPAGGFSDHTHGLTHGILRSGICHGIDQHRFTHGTGRCSGMRQNQYIHYFYSGLVG
jgi:hypothetical protein